MIDWKPIKDVPTIDIYNFLAPIPNILLFHPSFRPAWSEGPKEGYVLGYAYLAHDGRKIVCARGWTSELAAECTHWAHLEPPKAKKSRFMNNRVTKKTTKNPDWGYPGIDMATG